MVVEALLVKDPVQHRVNDRKEREQYYAREFPLGKPSNIIDTLVDAGLPDDLWICDICNDEMELDNGVMIIENMAMCNDCITRCVNQYDDWKEMIVKDCPDCGQHIKE